LKKVFLAQKKKMSIIKSGVTLNKKQHDIFVDTIKSNDIKITKVNDDEYYVTNDTGKYRWFMFKRRFHEDNGRELIEVWQYRTSIMFNNSNEDVLIRLTVIDVY
jgi:hypothetical protein